MVIEPNLRTLRLEMLLISIYSKLPDFIKKPLGDEIRDFIKGIAEDAVEEFRRLPIETQHAIFGHKKQ